MAQVMKNCQQISRPARQAWAGDVFFCLRRMKDGLIATIYRSRGAHQRHRTIKFMNLQAVQLISGALAKSPVERR
jgi:hypothetical protein